MQRPGQQAPPPVAGGRGAPVPGQGQVQSPAMLMAQRRKQLDEAQRQQQAAVLQRQQQVRVTGGLQAQQAAAQAGGGGASAAVAAAPPAMVIPADKMDFDFLPTIVEVLRLVEEGQANSDAVKQKVEYLQAKFASAKTALENMDGADLSEEMQLETFDIYEQRLKHINTLMAEYAKLPLFSAAPSQ